jgi:hypothetical protein
VWAGHSEWFGATGFSLVILFYEVRPELIDGFSAQGYLTSSCPFTKPT